MPTANHPLRNHRLEALDTAPLDLVERMFESTSDGVLAIGTDYRIITINDAAARALGVAPADVIGRPCHEVLRANICHDCCAVKYVLETGRSIIDMAVDFHADDPDRVPAAISCSALLDDAGRPLGAVETFRFMNRGAVPTRASGPEGILAAIVTGNAGMRRIFELLPTIAGSESTVLVRGETGTGKTLIAKAVHGLSLRAKGPLVTVNCGALPETLLESELFGYRAGAFTDAVRDRPGRIAAAEGGTLFLDEIGDLSMSAQVKLLRFLQDRIYERLGDDRPIAADVRVVTATNRDLQQLVADGLFRQDLYYRINVMSVELPALRERRGDIPLLVRRFLERFSLNRRKHVTGVSPEVLRILQGHDYPGNIRELENIIEHAFVLCPGPIIELAHLPLRLLGRLDGHVPGQAANLGELEAWFIRDALERNAWNRQATAEALGIHTTTLQRKIRRLGVELPRLDGRSSRRIGA
jgi:transcriptional regulator with PAS, ATPase and Fis domain